jgi:hypothetical protein
MVAIRCTRQDQDDVRKIVTEGGPRILKGQLMASRASLGVEPQLFEVESYDRTSNTFVLQHPVSKVKLHSQPFASDLYIGENTREIGNSVLELLRGVGRSTAPYMARRPERIFRVAGAPRSPERGFADRRRERAVSPLIRASSPAIVSAPPPVI